MGELSMRPFNLNEYLKNPSKKLVTRDGRKVRIICTDRKDADYPIVVLVSNKSETGEDTLYYTEEGKFYTTGTSVFDLFFEPEKHREGWVNIYRNKTNGESYCGKIYESEDDAKTQTDILTTIKIEWEE